MNHSSFIKTIFATIVLLAPSLRADEDPVAVLKERVEVAMSTLSRTDLSFDQKRDQVRQLMDSQFSFDAMIRGALGRNRSQLSDEQMARITDLVTDLVIRAYLKEFDEGKRPQIRYRKAVDLTKNKIEVPSIITVDGTEVNLTYRLAKLQSGWQVYDLIVEGVSMVLNYRKQFDQHFQTKGVPELIELIQKKIDDFQK